ncbi:peptide abc transporter substrate-binding protein : : SBP_bac_5 [Gemmataceae bacterium]|nr:peptide abc transporter substrate-binding protein : : SBP_bac_5 [Gemmataceae bacterium]VTT99362.1 peptide abc transporter substrate-binding protein : : SBP_bac_5 [Gemmataceae bacterium]
MRPARHRPHTLPRFAALLLFAAGAAVVGAAPQTPPEVEDPKGKVKKKIVVDDEPVPVTKGPVGNPPDAKLDELVRAADEARSPELKALFAKYAVPADRVTEASGGLRVKPVPLRRAEWPKGVESIAVTPLDAAGKPREPRGVPVAGVRAVDHFEAMAVADVEPLVKSATPENLAAAEKLLAAVLRFHDYARERNVRRGKTWDEVREPLAAKLRDVRLDQLRTAVAARDAVRVNEASTRLMNAYPKDAAVAREVAVARVGEVTLLLKSASHADHVRAREVLDELDARFPGAGGEPAAEVRRQLREMAVKAFTRARDKKGVGDLTTARDELTRAAALDPTVDGIREMQRELRTGYPILHVGVRNYPEKMSPATARLDSEKQVVDLVFEGLLEEIPDGTGAVRYRPAAALGLPASIPGGREFALRAFDRDPSGRPGFDSHDVVATVKLLRDRADTWPGYALPWLGGPAPRDNSAVRVPLALGHPDPRAVLTFKMLPGRWMAENGKTADDGAFAEKPFGTGPFKLYSSSPPGGKAPREMVFIDNPAYGRWRDRAGLPYLREIRLVEASKLDPVEAFRTDKLHVLPDVPTGDIPKFEGPTSQLGGRVQVVTAQTNRRVHVLAINLQRSYLQSKPLRQGLSMALDREDILREVFRAGRPEFHRAMTGPYPPTSWANPKGPGGAPQLVNRDLAVARLKAYLSGTAPKTDLELAFPKDDPRAEEACRRIKAQIEGLTKDAVEGRKITINLNGVSTPDLYRLVEGEHRYDLAYVPFDYPDDWHPYGLGAALDSAAATRGGRNWFSFLGQGTNPDDQDQRLGQMLNELRGYRDVGELTRRAIEAGKLFNECVPFVPLWQLDRHTAVHTGVKVYLDDSTEPVNPKWLNPTTLFQNVGRWRLE